MVVKSRRLAGATAAENADQGRRSQSRGSCRNCRASRRCRPIRNRPSPRCRLLRTHLAHNGMCRYVSFYLPAQEDRGRAGPSCPPGLLGPVVNDEFSTSIRDLYNDDRDGADRPASRRRRRPAPAAFKVPGVVTRSTSTAPGRRNLVEFSQAQARNDRITRRRCSIRSPSRTSH